MWVHAWGAFSTGRVIHWRLLCKSKKHVTKRSSQEGMGYRKISAFRNASIMHVLQWWFLVFAYILNSKLKCK